MPTVLMVLACVVTCPVFMTFIISVTLFLFQNNYPAIYFYCTFIPKTISTLTFIISVTYIKTTELNCK